LGVEVSLICGAMYPCSSPELVVAVSEAGGLGVLQPPPFVFRPQARIPRKPEGDSYPHEKADRAEAVWESHSRRTRTCHPRRAERAARVEWGQSWIRVLFSTKRWPV